MVLLRYQPCDMGSLLSLKPIIAFNPRPRFTLQLLKQGLLVLPDFKIR